MDTSPSINDELSQKLSELSALVDAYSPLQEHLLGAIMLAIIAIAFIVIQAVGLLVGFLLLGLVATGFAMLAANGAVTFAHFPTEKEYAKRACQLMSSCINLHKYPGNDPLSISSRMILVYESDGNLPLYEEFISIFPRMASKKLQKLSSIKFGHF